MNGLFEHTKRPFVIYAVDIFNAGKAATVANEVSIIVSDKDGFTEVIRDLPRGPLDLIIHSPGGLMEATESIVSILRERFTEIRAIIPNYAKSAATMLALSADEISLTSSAELGPIDPQMIFSRDGGQIVSPVQAIIDQFEAAEKELAQNPSKLPAWIPILPMYGPSLYQDCKNVLKLSKEIVRTWLVKYMFKAIPSKKARIGKATKVVNYFADHKKFKSHARRIGYVELEENLKGILKVKKLEDDPELYNRLMGVYYSLIHLFLRSPAFKIIVNHTGKKYVRQVAMPRIQLPIPAQPKQSQ
jgi:hypothetical protein